VPIIISVTTNALSPLTANSRIAISLPCESRFLYLRLESLIAMNIQSRILYVSYDDGRVKALRNIFIQLPKYPRQLPFQVFQENFKPRAI
jgi:DNA-binding MurR/RpiR family transcriptional regulator